MNSSITVKINPAQLNLHRATPAFDLPSWLTTLVKRVFATAPAQGSAESVEHLLALADAYEMTQPSYAADLRAAAEAHQALDENFGRRVD